MKIKEMKRMGKKVGLAILLGFLVILIASLISGLAAWLVWTLIITPVFSAPALSYWQMYFIILAINLIFTHPQYKGDNK